MPWSLHGQDRFGQRISRMSCSPEYKRCSANNCTTCTSLEGIPTMIPSTRLCFKKSIAWNILVVLFLALLSLPVPACMRPGQYSKVQDKQGEPDPRPSARVPMMSRRLQSIELKERASSLLSPWQSLPMKVHSPRTIVANELQIYMTWIDLSAPNGLHWYEYISGASQTERLSHDMENGTEPGPQNISCVQQSCDQCMTTNIALCKHALTTRGQISRSRHRAPVAAPYHHINGTRAPSAKHGVYSSIVQSHNQNRPGIRENSGNDDLWVEPLRTDAHDSCPHMCLRSDMPNTACNAHA